MTSTSNTKFKRVKDVTSQVLSLRAGTPRFFYFRSPIYVGKKIDDQRDAAKLVDVVDMETGEYGVHIVGTVEQNEIGENYPGNSYVGKGFELNIVKAAIPNSENKKDRYNHISIAEVSVPDDILEALKALPPSPGMAQAPVADLGQRRAARAR